MHITSSRTIAWSCSRCTVLDVFAGVSSMALGTRSRNCVTAAVAAPSACVFLLPLLTRRSCPAFVHCCCRGHSFFTTNETLLASYSKCASAADVISCQNAYLAQGGPVRFALGRGGDDDDGDEEEEGGGGEGGDEDEEGDEEEEADLVRRMNRELPPTDSDDDGSGEEEDEEGAEARGRGHGQGPEHEDVRRREEVVATRPGERGIGAGGGESSSSTGQGTLPPCPESSV